MNRLDNLDYTRVDWKVIEDILSNELMLIEYLSRLGHRLTGLTDGN